VNVKTYHKDVWGIGPKDIQKLKSDALEGLKTYICADRVAATLNKQGQLRLYVPRNLCKSSDILTNVMQLALKLEVKKIEVAKYELLKDMYNWDKVLQNFNLSLETTK